MKYTIRTLAVVGCVALSLQLAGAKAAQACQVVTGCGSAHGIDDGSQDACDALKKKAEAAAQADAEKQCNGKVELVGDFTDTESDGCGVLFEHATADFVCL